MIAGQVGALYFGPPERPLFGWLHRPAEGNIRSTGIVVCNSLGYDSLCLHRMQRHLAAAATQQGVPVLRFDYDGKGDSAGADTDPDRLTEWIASIRHAVQLLIEQTGVTQVYLFGVRVGATLAMLAAQDIPSVAGLVAVGAVTDGRRYLRELRAMAVTSSQVMDDADPNGIQDFSGLVMTSSTRQAISAIKLAESSLQRAPGRVLLVERADLAPDEALPLRLSALGCAVERLPFSGYMDMMRSAHESVVPDKEIPRWLDFIPPNIQPLPEASRAEPLKNTCTLRWPGVHGDALLEERAVWLDGEGRTFGIVTLPTSTPHPNRAVLLLNSGAIHHIGPHRLYVRAARECAARGVMVVRLDLPGLGDSPPLPDHQENATYPDDAVEMIRPVVDYVQQKLGATEVDCAGICSGAYHGLKAAAAGIGFRKLTVVNPLTFFWKPELPLSPPEFQDVANMQRYRRKGFSLSDWARLLRGEVHIGRILGVLLRRWSKKAVLLLREFARLAGIPLREDLAAELRDISRRGTQLHFIFADRDPGGQMLKDEGGWSVSRIAKRGGLDILTVSNADHTFTSWRNQQTFISRLTQITAEPPHQ